MSLSSLIVQREIASIREIEEALARQVLYGGDFVTNLFEVGSIDESVLMPVVAESYGLTMAPVGELPRAPAKATRLVAADVVAQRGFAPLEVGASLVVAVAEPLSADAAQELAFALALPIEQRIAPLFRIRQALARDYGVPLDKRTARLITKVVNNDPGVSSTYPPPFETSPLYRSPPRPPSFAAPPPRQAIDLRRTLSTAPGTFVRNTQVPPPRAIRRHRGPLTTDLAKAELDAAVDRDVVFDLLFEFARQFFDYTAVFIVQGDVAEGRDAFGDGAPREKVARIRVPFEPANILAVAHNAKQFVRQRPSKDGLDRILMMDLGRDGMTECVVFPIIVRKRVVALLFGDGGPGGIDIDGVGQVNELIGLASSAFERVIMRRKLKGGEAANQGASPGTRTKSERSIPVAIVAASPPRHSERPTNEELALPIRDLLAEPAKKRTAVVNDAAPATRHDPFAAANALSADPSSARSDRPPPENLLAVRRPSGRPIPREEPTGRVGAGEPKPLAAGPPRTKSQTLQRAEAPRFDFGGPKDPSGPSVTEDISAPPRKRSQSVLAQTLVSSRGESPFAESAPSIPAAPITDVSPRAFALADGPVHSPTPPEVRAQPFFGHQVTVGDDPPSSGSKTGTLTSGLPMFPAKMEAPVVSSAPITPLVVVTPDQDMKPIPLASLTYDDATPLSPGVVQREGEPPNQPAEPVLALSQRKGAPPILMLPSDPRPMPMSEQQVSVPAHKPPSSRGDGASGLPSVIVDVASEFVTLVDRVLAGPDEEAETSLMRAGGYAMPAIMARFPGPIVIDADRLESGQLPRVAECGPVIRLIASQRRTALPFVLAHVEGADLETRFWATYLLTELVYPDAIDAAIARTFDEEERIRKVARAAVRALAESHPQPVIERLAEVANTQSVVRRVQAIEALAETRDPVAVAAVLPLLEEAAEEVVEAARVALVFLTQQDFGRDTERWLNWWQDNRQRHRLEWLIDALMHDQRAVRGSASEELRIITKEYFGYYDDLPKRERERAQARYREWWENIGRVRFSRAANRGL